jgi:hypothetical protein
MSLNITIPERGAVSPAPVPATEKPEAQASEAKTVSPDAEQADGPKSEQPPAAEQIGKPDEKEPTPGELARRERNRQRWQAMKQERHTALAEVARLKAENDRLRSNPIDYSKIEDPEEALALRTAQKVKESFAGDYEHQAKQHQDRANDAMMQAWDAIKEEMRAKAPDFDSVVTDQTPIHPRMAPYIVDSDKGGDLAYWLGKNPAAAQDLFRKFESSPAIALIELGRIEAQLSAPASKPVSAAPRPAPVLSGGSNPPAFDAATASVSDMAGQLRKAGIIR